MSQQAVVWIISYFLNGFWFLYLIGFILHGLQITFQILVFLTCQEKRWQRNQISIDLLDFRDELIKLRSYELFVLGIVSNQIPDGILISFLQILRDRKCRTRKWTCHIPWKNHQRKNTKNLNQWKFLKNKIKIFNLKREAIGSNGKTGWFKKRVRRKFFMFGKLFEFSRQNNEVI